MRSLTASLSAWISEGRSIFNELLHRKGCPVFYAFDLLYLNGRDLRQLPLIERKEKLRQLIEKSRLSDVICGKYVEGRGIDLFNAVCQRNLEGVVAKRKTGTYATVSGWLKIKNPTYTQSQGRHELFETCSSPIRCARHEKDFFLLSASSSVWDCRLIRRPAKDARRKREPCLGRVTSENGS
jgi:hypothetical protein